MTDETTIGKLKEPIELRLMHPTIAHGPDAPKMAAEVRGREIARAYGETLEKLQLLFKHYGLARTGNDAADYRTLVLRMASERFRGFEIVDCNAPKPYQHKRGNPVALMGLLADVEAVKQQRLPERCSDSEAVRILTTSSRFADRWGRFEKRTLQNWFAHAHDPARNKMLPLWRLAADHGQLSAMINVFGSQASRSAQASTSAQAAHHQN